MKICLPIIWMLWGLACTNVTPPSSETADISAFATVYSLVIESYDSIPLVDGFDFPVGPPDARGYYNAQPFGENYHLGDDWNGVGGGNTDLGDSIYTIAHGRVVYAEDAGPGWGNVVRILHRIDSIQVVESLYAHLDTLIVAAGDRITRGESIGTIGTADGMYLAHLHLEMRTKTGLPIGGGYSTETDGFVDPTAFIQAHRE